MRRVTKFFRRLGGVLCAIMLGVLILAVVLVNIGAPLFSQAITMYVGANDTKVEGGDGTQYFQSDYSSADEEYDAAAKVARNVEAEGITLLSNYYDALPLAQGSKVSVFGQDSVDLLYGGTGSGSVDVSKAGTLKDALEQAGLSVNPTLWDFYQNGAGAGYRKEVPSITGSGSFAVNEVPQDAYTDEVKASYAEYSDAAIVVIGRTGSESADLPSDYLALTPEENDEIHAARANFGKVILLLNTANPVELGDVRDQGVVDAVLWMGMPGQAGLDAVGDVLAGLVNPSGRTVDTYAAHADSAPAATNLGDYTITNATSSSQASFLGSADNSANKYLVYAEGIYVGYRYYETRYEDVVMGQEGAENFNYGDEVVYSFGYGCSYTSFDWSDYAVEETDDAYNVAITVTNTGDVAGKDVVELYLQKPYTDYDKIHGIEKSSVELVGFQKTKLLEPGESQQITMSVSKESLRSYDAKGAGTYILEPGTYYLAVGQDAHRALSNILAAKGYAEADMTSRGDSSLCWAAEVAVPEAGEAEAAEGNATTTGLDVSLSQATGNAITNQFQDADITTYDPSFSYLTRSDWEGTFPEAAYQNGSWEAPQEVLDATEVSYELDGSASMPTFGSTATSLTLAQLIGADFDDERWNQLMDQMSKQELWDLVRKSGYLSLGIDSIGMPQVTLKDGPAGISGTLTGGNVECMGYPAEVVLASTYNRELVQQMGQMVGEDSLASGVAVWYAPLDGHSPRGAVRT